MKELLKDAVIVGEAMAIDNDWNSELEAKHWMGKQWENAICVELDQKAPTHYQLDERAAWFYEALTTSKGMKNRAFLVGLRIYGSAVEFFDQTWKPDDIVKVK